MDSTNIDLIEARIAQISAILLLLDPNDENAALWAVHDLLDQTKEAAQALWQQGIDHQHTMAEATA